MLSLLDAYLEKASTVLLPQTLPQAMPRKATLPAFVGQGGALGVDRLRAVLVEWDARFFSYQGVERPLPRQQLTPYNAVGKKAAALVGDLRLRYLTIFAAYAVAMAANQAAEDWYSCHTNKFSAPIDWEPPGAHGGGRSVGRKRY